MLRNFIKTACRNLVKHKAYSLINIFGPAPCLGTLLTKARGQRYHHLAAVR